MKVIIISDMDGNTNVYQYSPVNIKQIMKFAKEASWYEGENKFEDLCILNSRCSPVHLLEIEEDIPNVINPFL